MSNLILWSNALQYSGQWIVPETLNRRFEQLDGGNFGEAETTGLDAAPLLMSRSLASCPCTATTKVTDDGPQCTHEQGNGLDGMADLQEAKGRSPKGKKGGERVFPRP